MRTRGASRCCTSRFRRRPCTRRSRTNSMEGTGTMSEAPSPGSKSGPEERATRWLSQGFEPLVASLDGDPQRGAESIDFDVVVVGTGCGGSVAAVELAKTRGSKRICVLERGNEHLPGSFPSRMADLAGHVRFP